MSELKSRFPQTQQQVNGRPLVYLDSAATALKPDSVIQRIQKYYDSEVANVHRGAHYFADQGTGFYEQARERVRNFINARSANEIVFTRGTTESLNLIASSFGGANLKPGDEILLTQLEHHSNIVPWQLVAEKNGARIQVADIDDNGNLNLESFQGLLSEKTKIVSFLYVSNALGTVTPLKEMIRLSKQAGATTVVDAAQSVTTMKTDVADWDCDFLVFSGHKAFGPTGIGVLYGKENLLNEMPPWQGGGSMIDHVSFSKTTYLQAPQRFEAGTPNVAGAIGLDAALVFLEEVGIEQVRATEQKLVNATVDELSTIEGARLIGTPEHRMNVVSFELEGVHHGDLGTLLDQQGVAVRVGHHCCQPLMERLNIRGTVRASFSVYNEEKDVEQLIAAVRKAKEFF